MATTYYIIGKDDTVTTATTLDEAERIAKAQVLADVNDRGGRPPSAQQTRQAT